jgi:hypothetical protein
MAVFLVDVSFQLKDRTTLLLPKIGKRAQEGSSNNEEITVDDKTRDEPHEPHNSVDQWRDIQSQRRRLVEYSNVPRLASRTLLRSLPFLTWHSGSRRNNLDVPCKLSGQSQRSTLRHVLTNINSSLKHQLGKIDSDDPNRASVCSMLNWYQEIPAGTISQFDNHRSQLSRAYDDLTQLIIGTEAVELWDRVRREHLFVTLPELTLICRPIFSCNNDE